MLEMQCYLDSYTVVSFICLEGWQWVDKEPPPCMYLLHYPMMNWGSPGGEFIRYHKEIARMKMGRACSTAAVVRGCYCLLRNLPLVSASQWSLEPWLPLVATEKFLGSQRQSWGESPVLTHT